MEVLDIRCTDSSILHRVLYNVKMCKLEYYVIDLKDKRIIRKMIS